jgi:hypothetical protein
MAAEARQRLAQKNTKRRGSRTKSIELSFGHLPPIKADIRKASDASEKFEFGESFMSLLDTLDDRGGTSILLSGIPLMQ